MRARCPRRGPPDIGLLEPTTSPFPLPSDGDITRKDADQIADELLLRVIVKFLADGILSDQERSRLGALAGALEVDTVRLERLEESAKSERYRQAVSEVVADGTVTVEEARMLNELQARFGNGGSRWTPGDVRLRS